MRSIEFAGRSVRSIEQGTHQRHERRVTSGTFSRSLSDCCASLISGSRPDCPVRLHGPSTRTSAAVARRARAADLGSEKLPLPTTYRNFTSLSVLWLRQMTYEQPSDL